MPFTIMRIKQAINTKTLLIPSLFLNAALAFAGVHYMREYANMAVNMAGLQTFDVSASSRDSANRPPSTVSPDVSSIPASETRAVSP